MVKVEEIFDVIRGELSYQDKMALYDGHVRDDLSEGEMLLAIDKLVIDAKTTWYSGQPPHKDTREIARKIAALCIRMCLDENGMPERCS